MEFCNDKKCIYNGADKQCQIMQKQQGCEYRNHKDKLPDKPSVALSLVMSALLDAEIEIVHSDGLLYSRERELIIRAIEHIRTAISYQEIK